MMDWWLKIISINGIWNLIFRFLKLHKQITRERSTYKFIRKSLKTKQKDFQLYTENTEFGRHDLITMKGIDLCLGKQVDQASKVWKTKKQQENEVISMLGILSLESGKPLTPLQKLQKLIYEHRHVSTFLK